MDLPQDLYIVAGLLDAVVPQFPHSEDRVALMSAGWKGSPIGDGLPESMAVDLLIAAVTHDLKAPLVTIQGFLAGLERAARQGAWDQFQQDTARIDRACARMRSMLEELQEFAREGLPLRKLEPVSLGDVVQDALEQLAGVRGERTCVELPAAFPEVLGNRLRLMRAVQNLLENAFRAVVESSEPCVIVSTMLDVTAGTVALTIRDNGCGLSSENLATRFQPYRQLGGRTGAQGLGLSISQRIIEAHGGQLTLDSLGPGEGATARVVLPCVAPVDKR